MSNMVERIACAEEQAAELKRQAAADARARVERAQAEASRVTAAANSAARDELARAEAEADAQAKELFGQIVAQGEDAALAVRSAAAKKLYAAAEYIIGKAGRA